MRRQTLLPLVCSCGLRTDIITSWTVANPGRRFAVCRLAEEDACGFWDWYDPQMCPRSTEVIPGLLRRINRLEQGLDVAGVDAGMLDSNVARLETENNLLRIELKKTRKRLRAMLVFALICLGLLLRIFFQYRTTSEYVGRNMAVLEGF